MTTGTHDVNYSVEIGEQKNYDNGCNHKYVKKFHSVMVCISCGLHIKSKRWDDDNTHSAEKG